MAAVAITGATTGPQTCSKTCVASGTGPDWTIEAERGGWTFRADGQAPLVVLPGAWQDTPDGRRVVARVVGGDGQLVLVQSHGLCRAGGPSPSPDGFATVTLPNGRMVRGCMAAAGQGPYRD